MDPLSQASIGAAAAQALSRRTNLRTALWVGALGGFLPDVDILIRSSEDPLLSLEYHRHFTHALVFIPMGGLIAAGIGKLLTRGRRTIRELWLPGALGWATHGLLDSCTSYGTYLLWPFSDARVAWHNVSIIDLLFTLPMLLGVILAVRRKNRSLARAALGWGIAYLCVGLLQRDRAAEIYTQLIASRGHTATRMEVKPSMGNNILFRAFYIHKDTFYADSIRIPWWGESRVYEGSSIPALDTNVLRATLDPVHQYDLDRFSYFSNGFLVEDPLHEGVIGDFRYSMVPNAIAPMWGIDVGGGTPGEHLKFERYSSTDGEGREVMLDQLMGR
jgi:inner membrane protein